MQEWAKTRERDALFGELSGDMGSGVAAAQMVGLDICGVDVVCDLVGGRTTQQTFRCVALGGRLVMAGFSGGIEAEDTGVVPRPIVFGNFALLGAMLAYVDDPRPLKRATGFNLFPRTTGEQVHAHLLELLAQGRIRPVVGRSASYADLPTELERMEARATVGRTVLRW